MRGAIGLTCFVIASLLQTAIASAAPILFTSRTAFEAQGSISFTQNFDELGLPPGMNSLGLPWPCDYTWGDLTYKGLSCTFTIDATTTWTNTAQTLVTDIDYSQLGISAAAGAESDLFGFDVGVYGDPGYDRVSVGVTTNLGQYGYADLPTADLLQGDLAFLGFRAGPNEFFTRIVVVSYQSSIGTYSKFGITNVSAGHAYPVIVPEPATLSLVALGIASAMVYRRRRKQLGRRGRTPLAQFK